MEEVNPLKESIFHGTLNIGLPTLDVYSDIALSTKLYLKSNDGRTIPFISLDDIKKREEL